MKKRVTGLGEVFFKSLDNEAIKLWYQKHLDIQSGEHSALFHWRYSDNPSKKDFMFNYRVENLVEVWEPMDENTP